MSFRASKVRCHLSDRKNFRNIEHLSPLETKNPAEPAVDRAAPRGEGSQTVRRTELREQTCIAPPRPTPARNGCRSRRGAIVQTLYRGGVSFLKLHLRKHTPDQRFLRG